MSNEYNIIFLDTNGVLNYSEHRERELRKQRSINCRNMKLCDVALSNIQRLCVETNSKIVITSSWRRYKDNGYYNNLVRQLSRLDGVEIIGETPILGYDVDKWLEIESWLLENRYMKFKKYIIIDDKDVADNTEVMVKCDRDTGFTSQKLYYEAYNKLMN